MSEASNVIPFPGTQANDAESDAAFRQIQFIFAQKVLEHQDLRGLVNRLKVDGTLNELLAGFEVAQEDFLSMATTISNARSRIGLVLNPLIPVRT